MKDRTKSYLKKTFRVFFYLYIIILSYFLFFSESFGRDTVTEGYRYNMKLLVEIRRFINYPGQNYELFLINIIGNVIAFMPFGFLLPLLNKKYRRFFYIAFLCLMFSLAAEVIQLLTQVGIFDVDDLLLNTTGGILGYLLFAISNLIYRRIQPVRPRREGK